MGCRVASRPGCSARVQTARRYGSAFCGDDDNRAFAAGEQVFLSLVKLTILLNRFKIWIHQGKWLANTQLSLAEGSRQQRDCWRHRLGGNRPDPRMARILPSLKHFSGLLDGMIFFCQAASLIGLPTKCGARRPGRRPAGRGSAGRRSFHILSGIPGRVGNQTWWCRVGRRGCP